MRQKPHSILFHVDKKVICTGVSTNTYLLLPLYIVYNKLPIQAIKACLCLDLILCSSIEIS